MHTVIIYTRVICIMTLYIYICILHKLCAYARSMHITTLVLVRARSMDVLRGVATACIRELPLVGLMMSACETTALSNVEVLDDHGSIKNWGISLAPQIRPVNTLRVSTYPRFHS